MDRDAVSYARKDRSEPQIRFTVVIPARNEESSIATCVNSVRKAAERASEELSAVAEVVVVDDGSSDATGIRAEASGVRVLRHEQQRGVLAAWNTGVKASGTPFVVFVDADCIVDERAFVQLLQAIKQPGVGVVSGRAVPGIDELFDGNQGSGSRSALVSHSSRFSAVLLDEIKGRLGDHDFIAIGRLMAIRREAWSVHNVALPHCDREVASSARRAGWHAAWVPGAKVYYHAPVSFSELRADWRRTRLAMAHSPQTFDTIPLAVQLSAAWAALQGAPLDTLCWVACRARLIGERIQRRDSVDNNQPVSWD
jgi:glycosyltransferase involved in cell wall biosynthesis